MVRPPPVLSSPSFPSDNPNPSEEMGAASSFSCNCSSSTTANAPSLIAPISPDGSRPGSRPIAESPATPPDDETSPPPLSPLDLPSGPLAVATTIKKEPSSTPFASPAPITPPPLVIQEATLGKDDVNPPVRQTSLMASARDDFHVNSVTQTILSIVVYGASGDLAKKKTYPAIFALFDKGFLPSKVQIVGYARSSMTDEALRERLRPFLLKAASASSPASNSAGDANSFGSAMQRIQSSVDKFLSICVYHTGDYDSPSGFSSLQRRLVTWERLQARGRSSSSPAPSLGRLMYLALPASVYPGVCSQMRDHVDHFDMAEDGHGGGPLPYAATNSWVRVIVEKPFGRDLASSEELAEALGKQWPEEQLYRIDHYLGKELVQNMLVLRFANGVFGGWWNRQHISNVQITFKEDFGTDGRGGYFDQYGIIRDVIQNHLMQVLALLTMEAPVSLHPDDIRDEKVKVIRCIQPVKTQDCLLGQYVAANGQPGYLDDPTVDPKSHTPTFAAVRLFIRNERWEGVPIVIKAGKALNERLAVVRVQFKTPGASIFGDLEGMRNELVIRFQPHEAIYAKVVVKRPGLDMALEMSELDLTYPERYKDVVIPDAYERLILDCIRGDQQHFVRRDELRAAWAVFTPLLQAIDKGEVPLEKYAYGSRGPESLNDFVAGSGFVKSNKYDWKPKDAGGATAATPFTPPSK
uniref:Glucose-6-phosphate 1-dehydrogenase n=1 Tax=Polytomella parva TaxID=51329 RepID=A0A7S0UPW7_9CHLO|mmetsp:Transcript_13847/g.24337  ORF Transcript_13847/g.24337 Transcript_13847/m.24337 type:complete len:695 (+) Transcript_13847:289-2373(+)